MSDQNLAQPWIDDEDESTDQDGVPEPEEDDEEDEEILQGRLPRSSALGDDRLTVCP